MSYEKKMKLLVSKVVEVEAENVKNKVPETGTFTKVFVTYEHPNKKLKGMLSVEADGREQEIRRISAGMFIQSEDRIVSNYVFKGTKAEVVSWLTEERVPVLIETYEHLKEKLIK